MTVSYILQLKDFFVFFSIGIIIGILYGLLNIAPKYTKNYFLQLLTDAIYPIILTSTFLLVTNYLNNGQFRFFMLFGYILGIIIERITLGKLFAKLYNMLYTKLVESFKKFKKTKLFKIVFK